MSSSYHLSVASRCMHSLPSVRLGPRNFFHFQMAAQSQMLFEDAILRLACVRANILFLHCYSSKMRALS